MQSSAIIIFFGQRFANIHRKGTNMDNTSDPQHSDHLFLDNESIISVPPPCCYKMSIQVLGIFLSCLACLHLFPSLPCKLPPSVAQVINFRCSKTTVNFHAAIKFFAQVFRQNVVNVWQAGLQRAQLRQPNRVLPVQYAQTILLWYATATLLCVLNELSAVFNGGISSTATGCSIFSPFPFLFRLI
jgi:hypothetical protein